MPVETLAGFQTWWEETGEGVRRALFLHPYLTHCGAWKGVQAQLWHKLKMRAFDMPGHGRSWDWPVGGPGDFQAQNVQIAAQLIDKRADVIGHSFGATVALRLARDYPDKVRTLTLIEPVIFGALEGSEVYNSHMRDMIPYDAAIKAGRMEEAARAFDVVWGAGAGWDNLPESLRASLTKRIHLISEGAGMTMHDAHNQCIPGALEAIKQPVLMLEGAHSPDIIKAVHDDFTARLPNVRRVMVAGAGHMVPITHPQAVAGEIAAFLKV